MIRQIDGLPCVTAIPDSYQEFLKKYIKILLDEGISPVQIKYRLDNEVWTAIVAAEKALGKVI